MNLHTAATELLIGQPVSTRPRVYIAPTAAGDASGSSWANAAALSQIDAMIQKAAQLGGDVWIAGDQGPYAQNASIKVQHGGTAANPVVVRGVDASGNDKAPVIQGARANPWTKTSDNTGTGKQGSEVFRIQGDASHIIWQFLDFKDQGRGCFRFASDNQGTTIRNCSATNVQSFIDMIVTAPYKTVNVGNFLLDSCTATGFSKFFFRATYSSGPGMVRDCVGDSQFQDGDNFASGCVLDGSFGGFNIDGTPNGCHDWQFIRCTMGNIRDTVNSYQNGDGFATEGQDYNVYFEDCHSHHNTDGGYDTKSANTRFVRCKAEACKRSWRTWGDSICIDCVSIAPTKLGGIGACYHFSAFHKGYLRVYGGSISQSASYPQYVFGAEDGSFIAYTPRTQISVPSSSILAYTEPAVNPTSVVTTIDESDTTPPTIKDSLYSYKDLNGTHTVTIGADGQFQINENKTVAATVEADKPCALRIVPTPGRAPSFIQTGTQQWIMPAKDYENDTSGNNETYAQPIQLFSANGYASIAPLVASIQNVNDNPIGPGDSAFNGIKHGAWWQVNDLGSLFLDRKGNRNALQWDGDGDPQIFAVQDKYQLGSNPLVAADDYNGFYLRTLDSTGIYWLEPMTSSSHFLVQGAGSLQWDRVTGSMCIFRNPEDVSNGYLISAPRGPSGTSVNAMWGMSVSGGQSYGARTGFGSGATSSGGFGITGQPLVLSLTTETGVMRSNGVDAKQLQGGAPIVYPKSVAGTAQARVFADGNDQQLFPGRFYGGVFMNASLDGDTLFRIERQLGSWAGLSL